MRRLLLLPCILVACAEPSSGMLLPDPTPQPTPVEVDDDDAVDDDDVVVDDDDVVDPPEDFPQLIFDPPGGGFVGSVDVSLTTDTGEGTILLCTSSATGDCVPVPGSPDLTLSSATILRARVEWSGLLGEVEARSYFAVAADAVSFESNLPLLVAWTNAGAVGRDNVPLGIDVLEGGLEPTTLLTTPSDSGRGRMHIRGSSSSNLDKKAYDMELWAGDSMLDRRVGLLGMPEDGDWVLYAPFHFDDALVRNPLGYNLSSEIGRYAPRTRFLEMFLATEGEVVGLDDYIGVYVLIEEIERGNDRVAITELLAGDVNPPEVTGGYVFKRDRRGNGDAAIWAGSASDTFDFTTPIVPVDPETSGLAPQQIDYLEFALDQMAAALAAPDGIDPVSGLHYEQLVDVDSFIDHNILNLFVKNPDAFRLSGYFFKDREGPIHAGPIWDLDRTAASIDWRARFPTWWDAKNQTNDCTPIFSYGWYAGLFSFPEFRERYWAQFSYLLENELSVDNVNSWLDLYEWEISEAALRNEVRWERPSWTTEMSILRAWLEDRHAWITACIAAYPDPRDCPGE